MLIMIGANNDDIICSSLPNNKIPLGEYIYDYLNDTINTENLYAVLFLSDNYYRSAMCLNEMGALWVKHIQSRNILIKGFDYSDITGVANSNEIAIKIDDSSDMTNSYLNDFLDIIKKIWNINPTITEWELAKKQFLSKAIVSTNDICMSNCRSYCIADYDNEGCHIQKRLSNDTETVVDIDFSKTDSKLVSIVYFLYNENLIGSFVRKGRINFDIQIDGELKNLYLEIKSIYRDQPYDIYVNEGAKHFSILLSDICSDIDFWKSISEIKFVVNRKNVSGNVRMKISNIIID